MCIKVSCNNCSGVHGFLERLVRGAGWWTIDVMYSISHSIKPHLDGLGVYVVVWSVVNFCLYIIPYQCHDPLTSVALTFVLGVTSDVNSSLRQDGLLNKDNVDISLL